KTRKASGRPYHPSRGRTPMTASTTIAAVEPANGGNNRASQPRSEAAGYSDWGTLRIHNANPAHMRLTSRPANTSDGRCQAAVTIDPVIRAIASAPTAEINK